VNVTVCGVLTMPSTTPKTLKPRQCKYCRAQFTPARLAGKEAKFCCPNHRKAYHRYGGLPFDKLMDRVRKEMKLEIRAEVQRQLAATTPR
jgi:hypothetical protein